MPSGDDAVSSSEWPASERAAGSTGSSSEGPRRPPPGRLAALGAIKLGIGGALCHGLAPLAAAPPASAARPILQSFGWLAWAGALACASRWADASAVPAGACDHRVEPSDQTTRPERGLLVDSPRSRDRSWSSVARGLLTAAPPRRPGSPVGDIGAIGGVLGVVAFGALLRWGAWQIGLEPAPARSADAILRASLQAWPIWLSATALVGLPALGEEAFFRGAALRACARHLRPGAAALLTSLFFAAAHPARPVEAMFFGASLAGLALATGRLREVVLAHAAHNAIGLWGLATGVAVVQPSPMVRGATACVALAGAATLLVSARRGIATIGSRAAGS